MKENGLLFKVEHKKACRMIRKKIKSSEPKGILGVDITKAFTRDAGWTYYIAVIDWYTKEILRIENKPQV